MRTTHTFGVQFIVRMNRAKDGLVPIYVRVTVDGCKVEISLKRFIDPVCWNAKKGMPRGSRDEIKALNHFLEQVKAKLLDCYQGMQLQDQFVTAETVKNKFLGLDENHHTLLELVESQHRLERFIGARHNEELFHHAAVYQEVPEGSV